jgi:hypothetical protein
MLCFLFLFEAKAFFSAWLGSPLHDSMVTLVLLILGFIDARLFSQVGLKALGVVTSIEILYLQFVGRWLQPRHRACAEACNVGAKATDLQQLCPWNPS